MQGAYLSIGSCLVPKMSDMLMLVLVGGEFHCRSVHNVQAKPEVVKL